MFEPVDALSQMNADDPALRRWRLILGHAAANAIGEPLSGMDAGMDKALQVLYDDRSGSLEDSSPEIARWLGDIRTYFPTPVVQMLQMDAIKRLNLHQLLLEPELLNAVEPDVHLIASLLLLNEVMPTETRETARQVVRRVVEDLQRRLAAPMREAVLGSLNRAVRNRRPRHSEIDWVRTIHLNLKHYQPAHQTIIPERRVGHGHRQNALRDVILCIDQSGSMASSVVYASIFGAVMASLPAVRTQMIVFDTAVVDLTEHLIDPVDLLFGTQLGGGTDIGRALTYCQNLIRRPAETILVLISDLCEGGDPEQMLKRAASIAATGTQLITLLALSDDGVPAYDHEVAAQFTALGVPCFGCTPDQFPGLMAAAIARQDIGAWVGEQGIRAAGSIEQR